MFNQTKKSIKQSNMVNNERLDLLLIDPVNFKVRLLQD